MRWLVLTALLVATPTLAKESLGVFSDWGAFRDPATPRCYAIAKPAPSSLKQEFQPFASVGNWPRQGLRGQINFRLARTVAKDSAISLVVGSKTFRLTGGGSDAWAQDKTMDAAIVAAMRSAPRMTVRATDASGRRFSSTYALAGVASAMDAATVACARQPASKSGQK